MVVQGGWEKVANIYFWLLLVSCLKSDQRKDGLAQAWSSRRAAKTFYGHNTTSNSLVVQYKRKYFFNSKTQGG